MDHLKNITSVLKHLITDKSSGFASNDGQRLAEEAKKPERELAKAIALELESQWEACHDPNFFKRAWNRLKYWVIFDKSGHCNIPKHVLEEVARSILPDIRAFFETEEGKREFEEWKKEQAEKEKIAG